MDIPKTSAAAKPTAKPSAAASTTGKPAIAATINAAANTAAKPLLQANPIPQGQTAALRASISSLVSAAGLPQDKLSASIISFAKFFSLPLKQEPMAEIRRMVFSQAANETSRTAFTLAAAAAESKGIELTPDALRTLTEAIDPDAQKDEHNRHQHQNKEQEQEPEQKQEKEIKEISAISLKETANKKIENNPVLEIVNRLPCKNGQKWVVVPFNFEENGKNYKVSLRILSGAQPEYMTLDIVSTDNTEDDAKSIRQVFIIKAEKGSIVKASAYLQPEIPNFNSIIETIKELTEILGVKIEVKPLADTFPFEMGLESSFFNIDEAV